MPAREKTPMPQARARAPAGKKQVLVIMDADVIKQAKHAAVEDDKKMSHVVEEAVREWLERRMTQKKS
jgi:hypothetical protein